MPRDGANVYTLPEAPFVSGAVASATAMNSDLSDIATALTDSFTRAETTAYTRTLLNDADAATAQTTLALYLGVTAGTSTAITATPAAALPAYATGLQIGLRITTSCGDQPTLNVSGLGAKKIYVITASGAQQAATGDMIAGDMVTLRYDAALDSGSGGWLSLSPPAAGWRPIGGIQVATSASTIDIALSSMWSAFRFTAWRLAPSANSGILWRISTDGGATYRAGGTDYDTAFMFANSGTPQSGAGSSSSVDLTGAILATDNRSRLHIPVIDPGSGSHRASLVCQAGILDSGSTTRVVHVCGAAATNGRATHMRLLPSSGTLSCAYQLEGLR